MTALISYNSIEWIFPRTKGIAFVSAALFIHTNVFINLQHNLMQNIISKLVNSHINHIADLGHKHFVAIEQRISAGSNA